MTCPFRHAGRQLVVPAHCMPPAPKERRPVPATRQKSKQEPVEATPLSNPSTYDVTAIYCLTPAQVITCIHSFFVLNLGEKKPDEICRWNLKGRCRNGGRCVFIHSSQPYLWQFREGSGQWQDFQGNDVIEEAFCNAEVERFDVLQDVESDAL